MKKVLKKMIMTLIVIGIMSSLVACGNASESESEKEGAIAEENSEELDTKTEGDKNITENKDSDSDNNSITGLEESAKDAYVDFEALKKINPDIFAWLYVPGTNVDLPILMNIDDDTYYESHDVFGKASETGAPYLDMHNYPDMCDFNSVIHGRAGAGDLFEGLTAYEDAAYFDKNPDMIIYLDGNVLTYSIVAAYRSEEVNLFKNYNFQSSEGCNDFIKELYHNRFMGKSTREEFEGLNDSNFLVTLQLDDPDRENSQLFIVAALVSDAANTIDRPPFDEEDYFEGYSTDDLMSLFEIPVE